MLAHMAHPEHYNIASLLEKHALGICTPEENTLLQQWYASFPGNGSVWQDAAEKETTKASLKAAIFSSITEEQLPSVAPAKVPSIRRRWWQAAAAAAILIIGGIMLHHRYSQPKQPVYVVISAPAGKGIVQQPLPDGSQMWLEPGTTVRYRNDFDKEDRQVELVDGMVFFAVQKRSGLSFTVQAPGGLQTQVLGTEFTVKAYRQLNDMQVMVKTGTVQVADSMRILDTLTAGQQLTYRQQTHESVRSTDQVTSDWRTGNLVLNNAAFAEVVRLLETRYGLQVVYNTDHVATLHFTLHIHPQSNAISVLELLKEISGLSYTLNDGTVTIQ
jgi:transmembrane sensor